LHVLYIDEDGEVILRHDDKWTPSPPFVRSRTIHLYDSSSNHRYGYRTRASINISIIVFIFQLVAQQTALTTTEEGTSAINSRIVSSAHL